MRAKDLILAALAQALGIAATIGVIVGLRVGEPDLALGVGAILGSQVGAWSYHSREHGAAPNAVKAAVGAVLAAVCVAIAAVMQTKWALMENSEVVIPIAAIGSFITPFVMFGTMQKAFEKGGSKDEGAR